MALEQFAYLADIVGGAFIVVTLGFLAWQIRQNTKLIRTEHLTKSLETQVYRIAHLTDTAEKADLVRRAFADFSSLSQTEKGIVHTMILEINIAYNAIRHSFEAGLLDEEEFLVHQANWLSLMRTRGLRQWHESFKHVQPEYWRNYVDSIMDDSEIDVNPLDEEVPWLYKLNVAES